MTKAVDHSDEDLIPSKKFRGVFFDKANDVWLVRVKVEVGEADCGEFLDEINAARHYDRCAEQLQDKPELNFPED